MNIDRFISALPTHPFIHIKLDHPNPIPCFAPTTPGLSHLSAATPPGKIQTQQDPDHTTYNLQPTPQPPDRPSRTATVSTTCKKDHTSVLSAAS